MSTMSFDTFELLLHWFRVIFVVSDPSLDFPLFVLLLICFYGCTLVVALSIVLIPVGDLGRLGAALDGGQPRLEDLAPAPGPIS